jgi:cell wall-associated NlpC family hydrolase
VDSVRVHRPVRTTVLPSVPVRAMPVRAMPVRYVLRALVTGVLVTIMLAVVPGTQAHAGPTVAEIEAQIDKVWAQAEPMVEQYNSIHDQYLKNKAKQADLEKKIKPLQIQVDLGQVRVGAIAAQAYKGQTADIFNALVSATSPADFADQLSFLDVLARAQTQQISDVSDLKAKYDAQKAPIDALVAQLAAQDADLASRKAAIDKQLQQLQKLRLQAYGTSASTGTYRPWPCPSAYSPTKGYRAALFACQQAGKPYIWAAAGPSSYDCSGLTMTSWAKQGVYLPHNAAAQRRSMPYISKADLQPGDLVFYYSNLRHVAIYVGNDKVMQAPRPGDHVRMSIMEDVGPIHSYGRPA